MILYFAEKAALTSVKKKTVSSLPLALVMIKTD